MKKCVYCKQEKDLCEFPKHYATKDNLDTRCKICIKTQSKLRVKLHKVAPPKPDLCECCQQVPVKWCLDHDHNTGEIRGWICTKCNLGIGQLGDDIESLKKAIVYLQKTQKTLE